MTKGPRRMVVAAVLFFAALIPAAALSDADGPAPTGVETKSGRYSDDLLQADVWMTEGMSTPNADGPMQGGRVVDEQLVRSQDPRFVRDLEAHRAEIDRMIARTPR